MPGDPELQLQIPSLMVRKWRSKSFALSRMLIHFLRAAGSFCPRESFESQAEHCRHLKSRQQLSWVDILFYGRFELSGVKTKPNSLHQVPSSLIFRHSHNLMFLYGFSSTPIRQEFGAQTNIQKVHHCLRWSRRQAYGRAPERSQGGIQENRPFKRKFENLVPSSALVSFISKFISTQPFFWLFSC